MQIVQPKELKDSVIATKAKAIRLIGGLVTLFSVAGTGIVYGFFPEANHKQVDKVVNLILIGGVLFGIKDSDRILKERVAKGDIYTEKPNDGNPNRDQAKSQVFLESKLEEDAVNAAKSLMERGVHPGDLEAMNEDLKMQLDEQRKLVVQYGDAFKGLAQTKTMIGATGYPGDTQATPPPVPSVSAAASGRTMPDRILDVNWQAPV